MQGSSLTDEKEIHESKINEQSLKLAEYQEIGNSWRHDDQNAAQLTATLLPLAIGAIVLPFAYPKLARIPVALGSIVMMSFWLFYYLRLEARFALRFGRAKEIEQSLGFDHHKRFDQPGLKTKIPSITILRIATFVLYYLGNIINLLLTPDLYAFNNLGHFLTSQ